MERDNTTTRTTAYRLGMLCAMAFAAALVTTARPAAAQDCVEENVTMCGTVYGPDGNPKGDVTVVAVDGSGDINTSYVGECVGAPDEKCGWYTLGLVGGSSGDPESYTVCVLEGYDDGASNRCSSSLVDPKPVTMTPLDSTCMQMCTPDAELVHDFHLPAPNSQISGPGTGTPGYWKNHPEAWPDTITVAGVTYTTSGSASITDAITLMGKVGGDKRITLFSSLISAKLNIEAGNNGSCIESTVTAADKWLTDAWLAGVKVGGSSLAWAEGEPLHQLMDNYNNGLLDCAKHRN